MKKNASPAQNDVKLVDLNDETDAESGLESRFDSQEIEESPANGSLQTAANFETKMKELLTSEFEEQVDEDDGSRQSNDKKVRVRSVISEDAAAILRMNYEANPKPNREQINALSSELKLSNRVLQVWYQNRRAKVGDF